jgi:hypothetical protein
METMDLASAVYISSQNIYSRVKFFSQQFKILLF